MIRDHNPTIKLKLSLPKTLNALFYDSPPHKLRNFQTNGNKIIKNIHAAVLVQSSIASTIAYTIHSRTALDNSRKSNKNNGKKNK